MRKVLSALTGRLERGLLALTTGATVATLAVTSATGGVSLPAPVQKVVPHRGYETVYVVNHSHYVTNAEVRNVLPAFQAAADKDFAPYWHTTAKLIFQPTKTPPVGATIFYLLDKSDIENALAYHTVDASTGVPEGKIFVGTSQFYGYSWTVGFTHELWEMLGDPDVNRASQGWLDQTDTRIWALENADPVEADEDGYFRPGLNGAPVRISDFVTEKWFGVGVAGPYDFMNRVQQPFEIRPGGYAQYWDGASWQVVNNFRKGSHDRIWLAGEKLEDR